MSIKPLLALAILLAVTGCKLIEPVSAIVTPVEAVANFKAPSVVKKGAAAAVTVHLVAPSGCTDAGLATATVDEENRVVTISGALYTNGNSRDACPMGEWYPEATATFTPKQTGTYLIRGWVQANPLVEVMSGGYGHLEPPIQKERSGYSKPTEVSQKIEVTDSP